MANAALNHARKREQYLFRCLAAKVLELEDVKTKPGRKAKKVDLIKAQIRQLRAQHIKAAAKLDRSRAKLGIQSRLA